MNKNNHNNTPNKLSAGLVPKLRFPEFEKSESWIDTELGTVANFINGRAYKQEELLDKGKYKVLRVGNFFTNNEWYYSDLELEPDKYCDDGDLLYAWSASFGPRIWKGAKTIYHYHIWKVLSNKNIDKQFLYILLGHQTDKMKSQSANGFALLHITKGTIEKWKCSIPKSEKEQQRIASCLSSLDEVITAESQKLDVLKEHKKGLLQNLFPQEGETLPRLRFKDFEQSGEWEETKLDETCKFIRGPFGGALKKEIFVNDGYAVYEQSHAIYSDFTSFRYFITEEKFNELTRFVVQPNDIIMSCSGTMGKFAIIPEYTKKGVINQALLKLTVKTGNDANFIKASLELPLNQNKLLSQSAGGAIKNVVEVAQIKEIKLSIPSLSEQQKIAFCLSTIDDLINAQSQKVETLKEHKKGLLQGLFPTTNKDE